MTSAVVTGGAGFIGSHIVDRLLDEGWSVTVIDDLSTGQRQQVNPKAAFVQGSVVDIDLMKRCLVDADYVFHTAALPRIQPSFDDPLGHEEVNVVGTVTCLMALRGSQRLKKLVFCSSSSCYGNPEEFPTGEGAQINCLSPYALQKYAAEQYCLILGERFDIPVACLRYFNVYGPRSFNPKNPYNAYTSVVGIFSYQKEAGGHLTITGDGAQSRDFVHVFDVARANLLAATSNRRGEVYNVGCGSPVDINTVADLFDHPRRYVPERKGEARITWADIDKIGEHLGWSPTIDLRSGLEML
jgi:UDP-glucose 4-epimerase